MPRLFMMTETEPSPAGAPPPEPLWREQQLDDQAGLELAGVHRAGYGEAPGAVLFQRSGITEGHSWVLLALTPDGVAVNGMPLSTGIRVLTERDEIHIAAFGRVFFSAECPPAIAPFPIDDANARCPRCQQTIACQSTAVRCACGTYYHQTDELPCFTYATCVLCGRPGDLDGTLVWTPEAL